MRPSRLNGAVIAVMLVAGIALLPVWRPVGPAGVPLGTLSYAPQGIAAYLWSQHFPARTNRPGSSEAPKQVWAPQVWGSWLELDPNTKVAVDSRIELVPTDFWAQYDEVESGGPLWNGWLENNSVEFVVTAHDTNVALEEALGASGRWRVVYSDDDGSVWQRGG